MKQNQIINISQESYDKTFSGKDVSCHVLIDDAYYGEWQGAREVLDKTVVDDMCGDIIKAVSKHISKYNPFPAQIRITHQASKPSMDKKKEVVEATAPKYDLSHVVLTSETREQIEVTLSAIRNRDKLSNEWGLSQYCALNRAVIMNFYGQAGTGKSMTAEAIAGCLGKKILRVNYSELESKYVGETPKNIKMVFERASAEDAVVIFDEADSFLSKRLTNITQSADYGVNISRSVMLLELERFDGIVIFTTNLIENYDNAFKRRILASIEFGLPDEPAREKIWRLHLGDKLPLDENITIELLAKNFDHISGADIKDIVFYAAVYALEKGKARVDSADFEKAYQYIMKRYDA